MEFFNLGQIVHPHLFKKITQGTVRKAWLGSVNM